MKRYVNFAYKVAKRSNHKCYQMAALIIRGGSVLSYATNMRGKPDSFHKAGHAYGHAEKRAILPHVDFSGATLIVVRVNGGCSRPCPDCFNAIQGAGIKRIGYVNEDRQFVVEKV